MCYIKAAQAVIIPACHTLIMSSSTMWQKVIYTYNVRATYIQRFENSVYDSFLVLAIYCEIEQ